MRKLDRGWGELHIREILGRVVAGNMKTCVAVNEEGLLDLRGANGPPPIQKETLAYNVVYMFGHQNKYSTGLPAPHMRTVLPSPTPALWQAWTPTLSGSSRAASSYDTLSGNL